MAIKLDNVEGLQTMTITDFIERIKDQISGCKCSPDNTCDLCLDSLEIIRALEKEEYSERKNNADNFGKYRRG